jgi:hypothetical protein
MAPLSALEARHGPGGVRIEVLFRISIKSKWILTSTAAGRAAALSRFDFLRFCQQAGGDATSNFVGH